MWKKELVGTRRVCTHMLSAHESRLRTGVGRPIDGVVRCPPFTHADGDVVSGSLANFSVLFTMVTTSRDITGRLGQVNGRRPES